MVTTYAQSTQYDLERARQGVLHIERIDGHCYRFFNYDDENPEELWENYHRTLDPSRDSDDIAALDAFIDATTTILESRWS